MAQGRSLKQVRRLGSSVLTPCEPSAVPEYEISARRLLFRMLGRAISCGNHRMQARISSERPERPRRSVSFEDPLQTRCRIRTTSSDCSSLSMMGGSRRRKNRLRFKEKRYIAR
jgi:hypothetical protein